MRPLRFQPEYPKRMMKYACRDFPCIRGYIRPGKASLSEVTIFNLLITRHKTAANLQGTKPAVWLAVRSVSCKPVSPGFLRKSREKSRGNTGGKLPGYRDLSVAVSVAVCRPAISCRTPVSRVECSCVNGPAVGVQGTGIARVLATGPTGCQLRLCRPDIAGRRFTPRPACLSRRTIPA